MRRIIFSLAAVLVAVPVAMNRPASAHEAMPYVEEVSIQVDEEIVLDGMLHIPAADGRWPAIVIAPGARMKTPVIQGLAQKAAASGIVALRFNWRERAVGGRNDLTNLSKEKADLKAALGLLSQSPHVDPNQIAIVGKSLGSIVAYDVLDEVAYLRGAVLLTPVCIPSYPLQANYPKLSILKLPVAMIVPNRDPLCPLGGFFADIARASAQLSPVVVAGDHAFRLFPVPKRGDPLTPRQQRANAMNVGGAADIALYWVTRILQTR